MCRPNGPFAWHFVKTPPRIAESLGVTATHSQLSAARARLARSAVAIDCTRASAAFVGGVAEVVTFEEGRVFVTASSDPNTSIQPRAINDAEQQLIAHAGERSWAHVGNRLSLAISSPGTALTRAVPIGALSIVVPDPNRTVSMEGLRALVRLLDAELAEDQERADGFYRTVLEGQRDAVVVLALDMTIRWVSQGIGSLLGRTPTEMIGLSPVELVHPDDLAQTVDAFVRFSQGLESYRLDLRMLDSSGTYTPIEITGMDLSANREVEGLVLTLRDGQRVLEKDRLMEQSQRVASAIVSNLRDGVIATDKFGAIIEVNETARSLFSVDDDVPTAALRAEDFLLVTVDGWPHNPFESTDEDNPICCIVAEDGETHFLTTTCQPISDGVGGAEVALGRVIVFSDITTEYKASEELRTQARHDQLTGLANRRQLDDRLREIADEGGELQVAACFVDLDGFKLVNDVHGHSTGDQLVRIAAKRLASELGGEDLLVRQGGDEFVALLIGIKDLAGATAVAERCRQALATPFIIDGQRFDVTGSIGVSLSSAKELSPSELLQHADLALYAAKDLGRNRVESFGQALAAAVSLEESQRVRLRRSLEEDRLVMHFQPLVDTESETTIGYEALARIRTKSGVLLNPQSFLESIASTSLVWDLDQTAFALSCQAAALLAELPSDRTPYVSCNFSSISVNHPEFLATLQFAVEQAGIEPQQIFIELTESAAFDVTSRPNRQLDEIVDLGFRLALDDFGTGYSSLSHLRDLPISTVKVDRSFIVKLRESPSERSIARAIVKLARDLDLEVVAEGVETAEQLRHAKELGFPTIQGWYYSRALSLSATLEDWTQSVDRRRLPRAS